METYKFECTYCGNRFQLSEDADDLYCPICNDRNPKELPHYNTNPFGYPDDITKEIKTTEEEDPDNSDQEGNMPSKIPHFSWD